MKKLKTKESKVLFIAGTGTGVGKTQVTGLLAHFLASRGMSVCTQKWIQTGLAEDTPDIILHDSWLGKSASSLKGLESLRMPYSFQYPASPELASRLEKKKTDPEIIRKATLELTK